MKVNFRTDQSTILLQGTIERPTESDLARIRVIVDELKGKHDGEDGLIAYRSSKRSGYKKLAIQFRSKPELVEE